MDRSDGAQTRTPLRPPNHLIPFHVRALCLSCRCVGERRLGDGNRAEKSGKAGVLAGKFAAGDGFVTGLVYRVFRIWNFAS